MVVQKYHQAPSNTPSDCSEKNIYFSQDNIKDSLVFLQNQCVDLVSKIAKENGALGLIVMSRDNLRTGSFKKSNGTLTSFAVSKDYGLDLYRKFNEKGNVRIKLRNHQSKSYLNQNLAGGTISNFTSVGPSAELLFKPEIGGIGGAVLSTLPLKIGGWGVYQGTSMATPYVSGSIALYLAVHGKKAKENPAFIKKKFMNYAKPVQVYKSHSLDSPLRQGAGLVQGNYIHLFLKLKLNQTCFYFIVYDAITQTALVSPSKISFNDTATDLYKTHVLTVSNWGSEDVTYYTYNNVSVALTSFDPCNNESYYGAPNLTEKGATITFSSDIITVPSQKTANVTVTVDLSDSSLSSFVYYGGFIQFKSKNNQYKDIHVPYFGVNGRQKDLPVLSPALPPFLNDTATNTTFINTDKKVFKFDSYGNSSIEINFSLVTPTNFIKCEIIDAHNDVLGYIPLSNDKVNLDLMTRNINSLPYYTFDVDSYYVPPEYLIDNNALSKIRYHGLGRYRLSALKLFGNPEIEEDWEVWNSSTVNFV
jgi:hypothetical protein